MARVDIPPGIGVQMRMRDHEDAQHTHCNKQITLSLSRLIPVSSLSLCLSLSLPGSAKKTILYSVVGHSGAILGAVQAHKLFWIVGVEPPRVRAFRNPKQATVPPHPPLIALSSIFAHAVWISPEEEMASGASKGAEDFGVAGKSMRSTIWAPESSSPRALIPYT